jgi:GntR family transcriptional regulator
MGCIDMKLDSGKPVPLYYQLQEDLKKKIEAGFYKPGDLIPTEKELQELYGVSRITVRNAVIALVLEDLLIKKQGFGTVVAAPRMVENFSRLSSFTEKIEHQGGKVRSLVLEIREISASARIAEHLNIDTGSGVLMVRRLRLVDETPLALFTNYISLETGISRDDDFSGSIFKLLEEKYGIPLTSGEKVIEAIVADEDDAEALQTAPGEPLLLIRNTVFDKNRSPVDSSEGVYRADRFKYIVTLER